MHFTSYITDKYGKVFQEVEMKRKRLKKEAVPNFEMLTRDSGNDSTKATLIKQDEQRASTSGVSKSHDIIGAGPSVAKYFQKDAQSKQQTVPETKESVDNCSGKKIIGSSVRSINTKRSSRRTDKQTNVATWSRERRWEKPKQEFTEDASNFRDNKIYGVCQCCLATGFFSKLDYPRFFQDSMKTSRRVIRELFYLDIPRTGRFQVVCNKCEEKLKEFYSFRHLLFNSQTSLFKGITKKDLVPYVDQRTNETGIEKKCFCNDMDENVKDPGIEKVIKRESQDNSSCVISESLNRRQEIKETNKNISEDCTKIRQNSIGNVHNNENESVGKSESLLTKCKEKYFDISLGDYDKVKCFKTESDDIEIDDHDLHINNGGQLVNDSIAGSDKHKIDKEHIKSVKLTKDREVSIDFSLEHNNLVKHIKTESDDGHEVHGNDEDQSINISTKGSNEHDKTHYLSSHDEDFIDSHTTINIDMKKRDGVIEIKTETQSNDYIEIKTETQNNDYMDITEEVHKTIGHQSIKIKTEPSDIVTNNYDNLIYSDEDTRLDIINNEQSSDDSVHLYFDPVQPISQIKVKKTYSNKLLLRKKSSNNK